MHLLKNVLFYLCGILFLSFQFLFKILKNEYTYNNTFSFFFERKKIQKT